MKWLRRNWKVFPSAMIAVALTAALIAVWSARAMNALTYRRVSADQQYILRKLGRPSRFTVAYLPLGERGERELVRSEVWYYPEHSQSVTFVRGRLVGVDEMTGDPPEATYPSIRPWDIDIAMGRGEVESVTGELGVPVDALPELSRREEVVMYLSGTALYAFESGKLVYFQSLGRGSLQ